MAAYGSILSIQNAKVSAAFGGLLSCAPFFIMFRKTFISGTRHPLATEMWVEAMVFLTRATVRLSGDTSPATAGGVLPVSQHYVVFFSTPRTRFFFNS